MEGVGHAQRVRVYLAEGDHGPGGGSLEIAILELLRREGCAGASVFRGIAGFGRRRHIHTAAQELLAHDLPVVVEWIDRPDRVERVLPMVEALAPYAMVTVEPIQIVQYRQRTTRELPGGLKVRDLMTREVETATPDTPGHDLVHCLLERDYRAVPIVDGERHVVGIVTNGDLVERGGLGVRLELLRALPPAEIAARLAALEASNVRAADVMTTPVVTVRDDAPAGQAAHLMVERRLKRLPVVDAAGRLVGIVSRVDLLRGAAEGALLRPPEQLAAVAGDGSSTPSPADDGGAPGPSAPVGSIATRNVPVVHAETRLPEVLDAVVSTRLNRAIVVDDAGRVLGIVTDADLIRNVEPHAHPGLLEGLMRRLRGESPPAEPKTAADVMQPATVSVPPDLPIAAAAARMLAERRKVLPVVAEDGRLVGAVDRADLLRALLAGKDAA